MTIAALVAGRPLRVGAVGPAVTAVQLGLRNDGRDLQADGEFGSVETLPAVKAFQASHGLLPTGVVDLATAAAFDEVPHDAWERTGRRSNGSFFTVRTLGQYFLHDVVHHLHDVRG